MLFLEKNTTLVVKKLKTDRFLPDFVQNYNIRGKKDALRNFLQVSNLQLHY
jgi:hypothetical protein